MSGVTKEEIIKHLSDDLSEQQVESLVKTAIQKVQDGQTSEDVEIHLMRAVCETLCILVPTLSDDEIAEMTSEISDRLINRMIDKMAAMAFDKTVPPREYLN